jgi:hypothetical protein
VALKGTNVVNFIFSFDKTFFMAFKFEKLQIWQLALEMSYEIHNLTRAFRKEELFILTSQIKRAADSISLNIAEGCTGQSNPEQKKFIGYANVLQ